MIYAGIIKRISAYLIDLVLLALVLTTVHVGLYALTGISFLNGKNGWLLEGYVLLTISLPSWLYFIFFETSRWQATPGKKLLGLMVTNDDGGRITRARAVLRTAVKMFPWETAYMSFMLPSPLFSAEGRGEFRLGFVLVYMMWMVYLLMMCWNEERQSMHDLIAESCVLDRSRMRVSQP